MSWKGTGILLYLVQQPLLAWEPTVKDGAITSISTTTTLVWLQFVCRQKKPYMHSELASQPGRCRGGRLSRWSCLQEQQDWLPWTHTCIYTGAADDLLLSVAPKLRTGSPLLHHGGQSCRDCTLMPLCPACFSTWVCKRHTVDLVQRCVVFLLSPWALIYIYAIWVNNHAAKSSI